MRQTKLSSPPLDLFSLPLALSHYKTATCITSPVCPESPVQHAVPRAPRIHKKCIVLTFFTLHNISHIHYHRLNRYYKYMRVHAKGVEDRRALRDTTIIAGTMRLVPLGFVEVSSSIPLFKRLFRVASQIFEI